MSNYIDPEFELMQHQAVLSQARDSFLKFLGEVGPTVALAVCALVLAEHQYQHDNPEEFPIEEDTRENFARNTDLSIKLAMKQLDNMKVWIKEDEARSKAFNISFPGYPKELALMEEQLRLAAENAKKVDEKSIKGLDN